MRRLEPLHSSLCHWRSLNQTVRIQLMPQPYQPHDVSDMKSRLRGRLSYSASCVVWHLRSLREENLPVARETFCDYFQSSHPHPPLEDPEKHLLRLAPTREHRHTSPWIQLHGRRLTIPSEEWGIGKPTAQTGQGLARCP